MNWTIDFISEDDFTEHVAKTIAAYGEKLQSYDIEKLNSNLIDPIKMIFDKYVYRESWEELISSEVFRQRDKSNNNSIGYFHQRIFSYFSHCRVPDNGTEGGWDVIFDSPERIELADGDTVSRVYVEMKNKHNTMNSASSAKTYIKMQNQLLRDDDCACFLVEAIAKRSQNIKWETSVDGNKVSHRRIRRVSMDNFYGMVTGEENAFFQICSVLPSVIKSVISSNNQIAVPEDTAFKDLSMIAERFDVDSDDLAMSMAIYLLGFSTYSGFARDNQSLERLYMYARELNK